MQLDQTAIVEFSRTNAEIKQGLASDYCQVIFIKPF